MRKLTKTQVIALIKKEGTREVFLLPSNCSPLNQVWVKPMPILLALGLDNEIYSIHFNHYDQYELFNNVINNFAYYNCNSELGNRVHYYIEEVENISQIQSDMCKHARENIRKEATWIIGDVE